MFFQSQQGLIDEEYDRASLRVRVARLAPVWEALSVLAGRRRFAEELERLSRELASDTD